MVKKKKAAAAAGRLISNSQFFQSGFIVKQPRRYVTELGPAGGSANTWPLFPGTVPQNHGPPWAGSSSAL